ncbi:MAG: cren protein [Thermoprotei archaeon]|nr:MAG: cren protein [Thermoprotei archaeon]
MALEEKKGLFRSTVAIKLASIRDLIRIASTAAASMQPTYILRYRDREGKTVIGFLAVFRDYYNLYGLPLFYYVIDHDNELKDANYVLVRLDESGEKIEPSKTTKPGYIAVPIVDVDKAPEFLLPSKVD